MDEKVLGHVLLAIGIIIMVFALGHLFFVFTGRIPPVDLFNSKPISLPLPNGGTQELVSADYLDLSSNLFIELLLMGFVASIGQKFASTGTSLIRPINVKLKAKDGTEYVADKK